MSELSEIQLGTRAQELHKKIIQAKKFLNLSYLGLGKLLSIMKTTGDFRRVLGEELGMKRNAWNLYLAQPEISIAPSTARGLILIYEKWIKELGFKEERVQLVDRRKLQALLPVVDEKNAEDWLIEAENLSRNDLFLKLKQEGKEPMTCQHEWEKIPTFRCKICHEVVHYDPSKPK